MEVKRPFSEADWLATPEPVKRFIEQTIRQYDEHIQQLEKRIEQLEARLDQNSQNSNKPPSSDSPFTKPNKESKKGKRKRGARKGHKGHKQELLEPTEVIPLKPEACRCGNTCFSSNQFEPFYTHQVIELPEIKMNVIHYILHKTNCPKCGWAVKASLPQSSPAGYGPRFHALVAEMSGIMGASRESVQGFIKSVLDIPISVGAIQKIIDRTSEAIEPIYEKLGHQARKSKINHVDETSWFMGGKLFWLWTMVNVKVAYFMVHPHRSKEAFLKLIQDWAGILVSDNYRAYTWWDQPRQTCLAHYIRRAKGLAERKDESIKIFGQQVLIELRLLCHWAKAPPTIDEELAFYKRFTDLVFEYSDRKDDAGKFARLLFKEIYSLGVFLDEKDVEPTNNRAERALRFPVLWRKRSKGTQSEKGNRWVERILSIKHTCRMRSTPTFPILVEAVDSCFKDIKIDLKWVAQG